MAIFLESFELDRPFFTLADPYRLVANRIVPKLRYANHGAYVIESEQKAYVKLAFWLTRRSGFETIEGLSIEEALEQDRLYCPMTLMDIGVHGDQKQQCYLLEHCNTDAEPLDFFCLLQGWLPPTLWSSEGEKERIRSKIRLDEDAATYWKSGQGAIVPTPQQLVILVVEIELRLASAIKGALSTSEGTWTLDTKFGKSTACHIIGLDDPTSADEAYYFGGEEVPAHEYQWLCLPAAETISQLAAWKARIKIECHDESLPSNMVQVYEYFPHRESKSERLLQPKDFEDPMPSFASFLCPGKAVASFVYKALQGKWQWRASFEEGYLALALYFLKLLCVTSGQSFAKTIARRPKSSDLPPVDADVVATASMHADDERHSRAFPSCRGSDSDSDEEEGDEDEKMEGVEEEEPEEEEDQVARAPSRRRVTDSDSDSGEDAERSDEESEVSDRPSRRESIDQPRIRFQEQLLAATDKYEKAVDALNRGFARAFGEGRGFPLMKLLYGWPVVLHVVGDEHAEELARLRKQKLEAQNLLSELTYESIKPLT